MRESLRSHSKKNIYFRIPLRKFWIMHKHKLENRFTGALGWAVEEEMTGPVL